MIHDASESKRLLSVLRDRPVSVDPAREEARRAQAVPLLEEAVRGIARKQQHARKRRLIVGWLAAIVSATVVTATIAVVVVRQLDRDPRTAAPGAAIRALDGRVTHDVDGTVRIVSPGDSLALPVGGELRTDVSSEATLETSQGLRLHLDSASRLALSGLSPDGLDGSVRLEQGQIHCAVPKLHGSARFSVVTPNARVVVHGTQFSVRVETVEAGVTRTCVRVRDGVVAVLQGASETLLHAGDDWGCGAAPAAVHEAEKVRSARPVREPVRPRVATTAAVRAQGTLAEETALMQSAIAAERRGRAGQASVAAASLIERYPDSPLAPEARAVLDRISQKQAEDR